MSNNSVRIAFYKGGSKLRHRIISWWTKSKYTHAELILPDNMTWVSITPFLQSKVLLRVKRNYNPEKWNIIEIPLNPREAVKIYQLDQLYRFIEETQGLKYDWIGMILSQFGPYTVKNKNKWYCSEWIAHALQYSRIVMWHDISIYNTPNMSPGKLYDILSSYKPEHYK